MSVSDAKSVLIVFAKAPVEGRVKTRLTAGGALNSAQACALYEACVREVWRRQAQRYSTHHSAHHQLVLYVSNSHSFWGVALGLTNAELRHQEGADLGERMYNALCTELSREVGASKERAQAALLIGTDTPHLNPQALDEARDALLSAQAEGRPCVSFGPAEDGGYVWVGLNALALVLARALFTDVPWSTSQALSVSLKRAEEAGLAVHLGPEHFDLDEPSDLARFFRERPSLPPHERPQRGGGFDAYELAPPSDPQVRARYRAALQRLYSLTRFGERMDLSTPRALNHALGDPLSAYKSLIIGGTNGKGSTCAHLSSLAEQAGVRAGRFSSPHLVSLRERVSVEGAPLSCELVTRGVEAVFEAAERAHVTMSFFEAAWALAAWAFRELKVTWAIWEVGLGGRLDATNVCEPVVSALTSVGLDHTHVLGDTLELIAQEKIAITRPHRPAFTGATGEGLRALMSVAQERVPQLKEAPPLPPSLHVALSAGVHERNAALALAVARAAGWSLSEAQVLNALSRFEWPGRLEYLRGVWLDCAHNPHAARSLSRWITSQRLQHTQEGHTLKVRCVFGASQDKDVGGVLALLAPHLDELVWVSPVYARCLSAEELSERYQGTLHTLNPSLTQRVIPPVREALEGALDGALEGSLDHPNEHTLTLVTGSCFLVGEARALLLGLPFPEEGLLTTAR